MTLTQLHYVITIAETKSFNKAAEALCFPAALLDQRYKRTGKRNWEFLFLPQRPGSSADQ